MNIFVHFVNEKHFVPCWVFLKYFSVVYEMNVRFFKKNEHFVDKCILLHAKSIFFTN